MFQHFQRFHRHTLTGLIVLLCLCASPDMGRGAHALQVGSRAPDFTLPDLQDQPYTLSSDAPDDSFVLLLIWGVWCPYCREIMVTLSKTYPELQSQGLEVISVSIRESRHKVALFANQLQPPFTVLVDEWADLKDSYNIKDVPRVVLMNSEHVVLSTAVTTSMDAIDVMIDSALEKRP